MGWYAHGQTSWHTLMAYLLILIFIKMFIYYSDFFIYVLKECIKPVTIEKSKTKTGAKITIQEDGYYEETEVS